MAKLEEICHGQFPEGCGAKVMEHRHRLNRVLASALRKISRAGIGPHHINEKFGMTHSELDNFQKLRYFGLIAKSYREDGTRMLGWWQITPKGRMFADGIGYCYPAVWTWRNEPVRFEGEPIEISDVSPDVDQLEDYSDVARPHREEDDGS